FSVIVFQSASTELRARLDQFGEHIPNRFQLTPTFDLRQLRDAQSQEAAHNILINLLYINLLVLVSGGVASYLMARRTLAPIQQAHEIQSRFVSDASHELRTPLAAMKTEIEVALRSKSLENQAMHELLESNLEEVNKLTALSGTLLSLSKMDYGSLTHEKVSLEKTVKNIAASNDKTGKRIKVTEIGKPLFVDAHQPSIDELFTILIDNALKYSPSDSLVSIQLSKRGTMAAFEITNTGKGISAENMEHIFDRFYRADNSRTGGSEKGFGLGLALAKTIVELHHGELTASSAPDHATIFTVLLPIFSNNTVKNQ
ncbi:MAG: ATP-binding protein, partial [Candidatus Saccharibacteria bacterium]